LRKRTRPLDASVSARVIATQYHRVSMPETLFMFSDIEDSGQRGLTAPGPDDE
jgi:hypothetical protein